MCVLSDPSKCPRVDHVTEPRALIGAASGTCPDILEPADGYMEIASLGQLRNIPGELTHQHLVVLAGHLLSFRDEAPQPLGYSVCGESVVLSGVVVLQVGCKPVKLLNNLYWRNQMHCSKWRL